MNIKKLLLLILLFFSFTLFVPKSSSAISLSEAFSSEDSIVIKIQEGLEYFFAFKVENKISVLDKHAEKRLVAAQSFAEDGNNEMAQNMIQKYQQIKDKQNSFFGKVNDGKVLDEVAERTIEQQKVMENIKTKVNEGVKMEVIQVQEQVINQVAKHVVEVNGPKGATNFLNEAAHVWAPGTGPGGGEAGIVYEGGGKLIYAPGTGPGGPGGVVIEDGEMKFAPGTSGGGSGGMEGADIKTIEIKTDTGDGSGGNDVKEGDRGLAPGTLQGGPDTKVDSNDVKIENGSSDGSRIWIDP